jgi:hypothetical protein
MVHGAYHVSGFFGYTSIADGIFEPLSAVILVVFAILMVRILYPNSLTTLRKQKGDIDYIWFL